VRITSFDDLAHGAGGVGRNGNGDRRVCAEKTAALFECYRVRADLAQQRKSRAGKADRMLHDTMHALRGNRQSRVVPEQFVRPRHGTGDRVFHR